MKILLKSRNKKLLTPIVSKYRVERSGVLHQSIIILFLPLAYIFLYFTPVFLFLRSDSESSVKRRCFIPIEESNKTKKLLQKDRLLCSGVGVGYKYESMTISSFKKNRMKFIQPRYRDFKAYVYFLLDLLKTSHFTFSATITLLKEVYKGLIYINVEERLRPELGQCKIVHFAHTGTVSMSIYEMYLQDKGHLTNHYLHGYAKLNEFLCISNIITYRSNICRSVNLRTDARRFNISKYNLKKIDGSITAKNILLCSNILGKNSFVSVDQGWRLEQKLRNFIYQYYKPEIFRHCLHPSARRTKYVKRINRDSKYVIGFENAEGIYDCLITTPSTMLEQHARYGSIYLVLLNETNQGDLDDLEFSLYSVEKS